MRMRLCGSLNSGVGGLKYAVSRSWWMSLGKMHSLEAAEAEMKVEIEIEIEVETGVDVGIVETEVVAIFARKQSI